MHIKLSGFDIFRHRFEHLHIVPGKLSDLLRTAHLLSILQGRVLLVLWESHMLGGMSCQVLWRKYDKIVPGMPFGMRQLLELNILLILHSEQDIHD
jgi:hypothetical protein